MIGEIRDLETAQIAVQASLTGHLVLATLHTNDAASAVTRLADMGVEPYLLSSSLLGVLAQRLVRTLCPACRDARRAGAGRARAACATWGCRRSPRCYEPARLRRVQPHRLSRPHRHLRADRRRRGAAPLDPRSRAGGGAARRGDRGRDDAACARTARAGSPTARRRSPSSCASRATSVTSGDRHAGVPLRGRRRAGPAAARGSLDAETRAQCARPVARAGADADGRRRESRGFDALRRRRACPRTTSCC